MRAVVSPVCLRTQYKPLFSPVVVLAVTVPGSYFVKAVAEDRKVSLQACFVKALFFTCPRRGQDNTPHLFWANKRYF